MKETIKIPYEINSKMGTNKIYSGVHWAIRNKDKEKIRLLIRSIVGLRKAYEKPVQLKMSFYSRLDVSNHSYLFKLIEDSLVKCGLLKDDTDKYVKTTIMTKQKEFRGVIVEIEEI